MIETVFALILTLNGNMIEHVYKPSLSDCLKSKRIAERQYQEGIQYKCIRSKAKLDTNVDGSKSIKALILE